MATSAAKSKQTRMDIFNVIGFLLIFCFGYVVPPFGGITELGMRMMGALLISSLLIFPALTAMRVCKTFRSVILCAACLSVVCFLIGMGLSFVISSPAGATVVVVNLAAFVLFAVIGQIRK